MDREVRGFLAKREKPGFRTPALFPTEVGRSFRLRPPSERWLLAMLVIVMGIIVVRAVLRWWWR